jgi:hypothetical protein
VTLVDSFVHNCYFNWTGVFLGTAKEAGGVGIPGNWIMPVMSVGQIAEILTMFVLGATLKRFGWRTTMIFGILGHAARFAVYPSSASRRIDHRGRFSRHLLRVLRDGLHFRGCLFPKDARASCGLSTYDSRHPVAGTGQLNCLAQAKITTITKVTDFRGLFLVPISGHRGGSGVALLLPSAEVSKTTEGAAAPAQR